MKNITVALPEDVAALVRVRAALNGRSASRWLAESLEEMRRRNDEYDLAMDRYLARNPGPPRWVGDRRPTRDKLRERSGVR